MYRTCTRKKKQFTLPLGWILWQVPRLFTNRIASPELNEFKPHAFTFWMPNCLQSAVAIAASVDLVEILSAANARRALFKFQIIRTPQLCCGCLNALLHRLTVLSSARVRQHRFDSFWYTGLIDQMLELQKNHPKWLMNFWMESEA